MKQKIEKLKKAVQTLKSEFVGIDHIIDDVARCVSPWYVTPEIIDRPIVVSLWGMTGTGKTSVVRRLLDLLDLSGKTVFFDMGLGAETDSGDPELVEQITNILGTNNDTSNLVPDPVLVFDEFQHARTIDESGDEVSKPGHRSLWELIDTGEFRSNSYRYQIKNYATTLEDIETAIEIEPELGSIKMNGIFFLAESKEAVELAKTLQLTFEEVIPKFADLTDEDLRDVEIEEVSEAELKDSKIDHYEPNDDPDFTPGNGKLCRVLNKSQVTYMYRSISGTDGLEKAKEVVKKLKTSDWTISEYLQYSRDIVLPLLRKLKTIRVPKSLIFVIGNLDEAFGPVVKDTSADIDADLLADIVDEVSVSDIKRSLLFRFKPEQVARFGNNIIKYPTLRSSDFKEIIKRETEKMITKFKEISGKTVNLSQDFYDLLYSESVHPSQGARSVFGSVSTLMTPILSQSILTDSDEVEVTVPGGFKNLKSLDVMVGSDLVKFPLTLGALRDTTGREEYIKQVAVHEMGHALMFYLRTGKYPRKVVAASSESGGWCSTHDPDKKRKVPTFYDIESDVMISMAGYLAEEIVYGPDKKKRLVGSGSDFKSAWWSFSDSVYTYGFFEPIPFADPSSQIRTLDAIPSGINDLGLNDKIRTEFEELVNKTRTLLTDIREFLIEAAASLSAVGSMNGSQLEELFKGLPKK